MIIPFGEYAPDVADFGNQGATTAKNVIPYLNGYKKFPSTVAYSNALTAYCRGAASFLDNDGAVHSYAGDATKLYRLVSATMTDSSRGSGYALSAEAYWEFTKWGNKCIATNFDDEMQVITLGGSAFADLGGTPPQARHINTIGSFVVVGNTYDGVDGNVPYRVRWSGYEDETTWAVSAVTQADYQDLYGNGGWVQNVSNLQGRGLIFQEKAIWVMTYVGSPIVFQFDLVSDRIGAFCPRGVTVSGNKAFFIAEDGFYGYSGGEPVPIGANKVSRTFINDLNGDYVHRVTSAQIPGHPVIIWSYPGASSADGTPDKCIMYNFVSNKWATAEFDNQLIYVAKSIGVTLDGLDALGYDDMDDSTMPSLDSREWMGGTENLAIFDTSNQQALFTGTAMASVIETGETQFNEGGRAELSELTPLVDGGSHTVQIGTRETQAGTVSWGSAVTETSDGKCHVRSNSRYHRIRVNTTGDFNDAIGVEVNKVYPVGER